ncbi:MAG: S8 family serine peptidase [Myxococcaceae bacterium]
MLGFALVAVLCQAPVAAPGVTAARTSGHPSDLLVVLKEGESPDALLAGYPTLTVRRRYVNLPLLAVRADPNVLGALLADTRVKAVQLDHKGRPHTAESAVAIRSLPARQQLGIDGTGVVVGVLDTGIDSTHPDLQGALAAQKCFVFSGCPGSDGGVGDLAPEGSGHGTHIAGVITSDGHVAPPGIAPGANLVMVRVFDDTSYGIESDWAAALDWLLSQKSTLGVRVVNMSLGADMPTTGFCDAAEPALADAIGRLRTAGILSFVSSGNDGLSGQIDAPACIEKAVAVGATYDAELGRQPPSGTYTSGCFDAASDAGTVICFSDSSDALDLLAPGAEITSCAAGGGSTVKRGTSAAAAHASAAAAMLIQADPLLSADEIENILKSTGKPITDPRNMRVTPLIQVDRAVEQVLATFCARHTDGVSCPGCDGGTCRCLQGKCGLPSSSHDGGTENPDGGQTHPTPPNKGCGCDAGAGVAALIAAGLLLARRRRLNG